MSDKKIFLVTAKPPFSKQDEDLEGCLTLFDDFVALTPELEDELWQEVITSIEKESPLNHTTTALGKDFERILREFIRMSFLETIQKLKEKMNDENH